MSFPSLWPLPNDGLRFVVPDFLRQFMQAHVLTKECFPLAMGFYPRAKGHHMRRPEHDDHLLIYCVEGEGELITEQYRSSVKAGELVVLPKGVPHAYMASDDHPWTIYWCHFKGSISDDFVAMIGEKNSASILSIGHSASVLAGFNAILAARKTGYSNHAAIHAANALRQLLSALPLAIQGYAAPHSHGLNVEQVQSFMWENIAGFLSLDELAAVSNLSKYHFSARYKTLTGYSPVKHFIHLKMEHACFLLDTTNMQIGEVGAALGYDDALYFSRLFKKVLGVSPKHYRAVH